MNSLSSEISGEVVARVRESESWNGRSSDVNLNREEEDWGRS